jgi:hypothetical protein
MAESGDVIQEGMIDSPTADTQVVTEICSMLRDIRGYLVSRRIVGSTRRDRGKKVLSALVFPQLLAISNIFYIEP